MEPASIADTLGRLVDKSLVTHHNGRWRLLETVRAFAAERREADPDSADIRQRYLHWAAGTAADLASGLAGDWREGFDIVANDLRAAMAGAPDHPDVRAHQLARSLGRLTFVRGFLRESADWCERAASLALTPSEAAGDLGDAADCAQVMNDSSRAYDLRLAAADRARAAGDGNALACALARAVEMASRFSITFSTEIPFERRRELLDEAIAVGDPDDPVVAARLACAAAWTANADVFAPDATLAAAAVVAARAAGDPALLSACLDAARTVATNDGLVYESHQIASQRLELLSQLDPHKPEHAAEIEDSQGLACLAAVAAGDLPAARSAARLITGDDLYGDNEYLTTSKIIPVLVLNGDLDKVVQLADAMWDSWVRAGRPPVFWMQIAAHFVALAHGLRGERAAADTWRTRVAGWTGTALPYQSRLAPLAAFVDARLAVHLDDLDRAAALVARALRPVPQGRYLPFARVAAAELAVVAGLSRAADDLASATPEAATNDWVAATALRAAGRLHDDVDLLAQSADRWARMGARFEHAATLLLIPDRAAEGRAGLDSLGPVPPAG